MINRLMELIEKEKLTLEELEEINCMEGVILNRVSGMCRFPGLTWYEVILENGEDYDVYA